MREREEIIRLWFDMWLTQQDLGIDDVFAENVIYISVIKSNLSYRYITQHLYYLFQFKYHIITVNFGIIYNYSVIHKRSAAFDFTVYCIFCIFIKSFEL